MDSNSNLQQLTVAADQSHNAGRTSADAAEAELDSEGQENKLGERSAGDGNKKDHGAVWRDAALAGQLPFHVQRSQCGCKLTAPPSCAHRREKKRPSKLMHVQYVLTGPLSLFDYGCQPHHCAPDSQQVKKLHAHILHSKQLFPGNVVPVCY